MKPKIFYYFTIFIIFILLFTHNNNLNTNTKNEVSVYIDNVEGTSIPDKDSNYIIDNIICDKDATGTWDNDSWGLLITNMTKKTNCKLYFRSKKDITITYDNNYIKNDIFEDTYDTTYLHRNSIYSNETKYSITTQKDNSKSYYFTSGSGETAIGGFGGFYFGLNNSPLNSSKTYTLQFIAKSNIDSTAIISSEQDPNVHMVWNIKTQLKKYSRTFTTHSSSHAAFVIYGWLNGSEKRILELTNIELQEGEYDNFSTIVLKENDSLGNTLPTPSRDGYTFLGWYTDPIKGEKISNNTVVNKNITYYAHWQYIE